jgi:hypothetical protein
MTNRQRRFNEYQEAIERLTGQGYVSGEYRDRYLATHFPDFNRYPAANKPFENSLQEIQCREAANKNKDGKGNG